MRKESQSLIELKIQIEESFKTKTENLLQNLGGSEIKTMEMLMCFVGMVVLGKFLRQNTQGKIIMESYLELLFPNT